MRNDVDIMHKNQDKRLLYDGWMKVEPWVVRGRDPAIAMKDDAKKAKFIKW